MALHGPPHVYDWSLDGACGASLNRDRALRALHEAVSNAPAGAEGVLSESAVTGYGTYHVLRILGRAIHDEATGAVIWSESA